MEMRCYRKILCISYKDHVTNEEIHNRIKQAVGPYEDLLTMVKRRKLKWYGHVSRTSGMTKTILQGTVRQGWGEQEDEEDRGRGGRTTSKSGQAWTSQRHKGQQTIGRCGDSWLQGRRWCLNDTTGYGIDDDDKWGVAARNISGPIYQNVVQYSGSHSDEPVGSHQSHDDQMIHCDVRS
ncbi:hypothetical protein LSAT2_016641 [Lamellibrachia satsuma]|nr:hypothetical protein LSAT2_016641 [Lamellibrachia satsuma]